MKLTGNTIVITGGSSGIGLELAHQLLAKNNTVIICGRSEDRLALAKRKYPALITVQCDVSQVESCRALAKEVKKYFPKCNILINNAAIVHRTEFLHDEAISEKALKEVLTNFCGPVWLIKLFQPILERNRHPAIINVTTGLVYAPKATYPFYNATKAALHSFTETMRMQFKQNPVKIIEVLFPVVDTPWHAGKVPKGAISAGSAAGEMIKGVENDRLVVRVGKVRLLYWLTRISPRLASKVINRL